MISACSSLMILRFVRFQHRIVVVTMCMMITCMYVASHAQEASIKVFDAYRDNPTNWMKYLHLNDAWYHQLYHQAHQYIDVRNEWVSSCTTLVSWEARKRSASSRLKSSIGAFPDASPLNAHVVDIIDRPTFTVEKILYESLPGFYVTAALFIPKLLQGPTPAIIYCSGHTELGFRSETYQHVMLNLVQKGFIVLAFDPIGQGERFQYLDEAGNPNLGGTTKEHSYAGAQCLISGTSIAKYMIFDGIRAVDYLLERPEVDPQRIGITGRSGGGTQSAYIAAYDDRIYAAAPENYITSFQRLWESIGPQDAEQNLPKAHFLEIDHADLLEVRAPKPALILTTTRDFFSIQGARESFKETQQIYSLYGKEDAISFAEDDHGHGSTKLNREAMYAFFQEHLQLPGNPSDEEVTLFSTEDLTITETGQVLTALDSKTIFDLTLEQASPPSIQLEDLTDVDSMQSLVQQNSGAQPFLDTMEAVFTGRVIRDGYSIEKYFLEFDNGRYPIPFFWISGDTDASQPLLIYLHEEGKSKGLAPGGEIEQWVSKGYTVLAIDVLNTGELETRGFQGDSYMKDVSYNLVYGSDLVGKSLTAFQIEDLNHVMEFALQQEGIDTQRITAMAHGQTCIPMLFYTALNDHIEQLTLKAPLVSWENLISTRRYEPKFTYTIMPGAYHAFDLPDLAAMVAPRKLQIIDPVNAKGEVLSLEKALESYELVSKRFQSQGDVTDLILKVSEE